MTKVIFFFRHFSIHVDAMHDLCEIYLNGERWPQWSGNRDELIDILNQSVPRPVTLDKGT